MASDIKTKDPLTGKIMQLEYALLVNYAEKVLNERNEEDLENLKLMTKALNDYVEEIITFNELWDISKKCGYDGEKRNLISSEGVDYGKIATFEEIRNITDDDVRAYELGYKFNGNPIHPEYFNLELEEDDKFSQKEGKTLGQFKYVCPKIGDESFVCCFDTSDRDEKDGDYWIELRNRLWGVYNDTYFDIRVVDTDGELLSLDSRGVRLSILLWLAQQEKYEVAFVHTSLNEQNEWEDIRKEVLSQDEINIFKSYIRAFIAALVGKEEYSKDLKELTTNPNVKNVSQSGCAGIFILPIIGLALSLLLL